MVIESDHPAIVIDTRPEIVPCGRAIEIVAHVVFAGPLQLDGATDFSCDPGSFDHEVVPQAPPEAAANAFQVGRVFFLLEYPVFAMIICRPPPGFWLGAQSSSELSSR